MVAGLPPYTHIVTAEPFTIDSTHAIVPGPGGDEYLIGDSEGHFFRVAFGQTSPSWTVYLGGHVTGPPAAMPDGSTRIKMSANARPIATPMAACPTNFSSPDGVINPDGLLVCNSDSVVSNRKRFQRRAVPSEVYDSRLR